MDIYDKIEFLMKRQGIDRKTMCENTKVPYSTFTNMVIRRSKNLKMRAITNIAEYFDVTVDYLMRDEITDPEYGKTVDMALTLPEQTHIKKYRDLDGHGKKVVDIVLDEEHERYRELKRAQEEQAATAPANDRKLTRAQAHQLLDEQFDAQEKGLMLSASTTINGLKKDSAVKSAQ